MDNIERYLRLATWGLWGEHKRTVRLELSSHIQHKVNQYEALGYTPSAAISRALNDLGPPHVVSAGMNGVYTMPNMLRNTLLCAVLATLGIGNLTSSVAQVASTSRVPIEPCNQNQQWFQVGTEKLACNQGTVWMRLSSLRKTLESKGVEITEPPVQIAGRITWYVRFPDSKRQSTLYIWQGVSYGLRQDGLADFVIDPDFIKMSEFLRMLAALDLPVTVQGWQNPTITVGKIKFSIGTSELSVAGNEFYNDVFDDEAVGNLFPGLPIINRSTNPLFDSEMLIVTTSPETFSAKSPSLITTTHRLKISNSKPGDVFLILAREGPSTLYASADQQVTVSSVRRAYIGSVEADGFITYKSPSQNLAISSDPLLPLNVQGGAGKISVVRFSGRIDGNVRDALTRVAPADVTVQAVK